MPDGEGTILIGGGDLVHRYEAVARHLGHGSHDGGREGRATGFAGRFRGQVGDLRHQLLPLGLENVGDERFRQEQPEQGEQGE
jgi:hypothetical protein